MLPRGGGAVLYHIQVAWETALFEHIVHHLRLTRLCEPLGNNRHTHKAREQMSFPTSVDVLLELPVYLIHKALWRCAYKEGKGGIQLQAAGVGCILLIIELLMNLIVDVLLLLLIECCIIGLTQNLSNSGHNAIYPAHGTTVHIVDTFCMMLVLLVGQRPVAQEPMLAEGGGPTMFQTQQTIWHILLGILQVALHIGIILLQHPLIAILQIGLPRSIGYEGAPEGASATSPDGWSHMRHFSVIALCIAVSL